MAPKCRSTGGATGAAAKLQCSVLAVADEQHRLNIKYVNEHMEDCSPTTSRKLQFVGALCSRNCQLRVSASCANT
jgi:hypothetical protein